jgi:hypothetical protein
MRGGPLGALVALSCPSASLCVALDDERHLLTSTDPTGGASAWRTSSINSDGPLGAVECASPSLCLALPGSGGEIFTSTDPGGSAAWNETDIGGGLALNGASCATVSLCVAFGSSPPHLGAGASYDPSQGVFVTSTGPTGGGAAWTVTNVPDQLTGLSCAPTSLCVATDKLGRIVVGKIAVG